MQICHHKPLQIHVDNDNKCEVSLRFWIMTSKIIIKKRLLPHVYLLLIDFLNPNFSVFCKQYLQTNLWQVGGKKRNSYVLELRLTRWLQLEQFCLVIQDICTVTSSGIFLWVFFWFEHGSIYTWICIMHTADHLLALEGFSQSVKKVKQVVFEIYWMEKLKFPHGL